MFFKDGLAYQALLLPDRFDWNEKKRLNKSEEFYDWMSKRHSVRDFKNTTVDRRIIENSIRTAGTAPSGANHQPWHFVAISNSEMKVKIRKAAEIEEKDFYSGGAGDEWLKALEPMGTNESKPHLEDAAWLIIVFAQRYGYLDDGTRYKNYYVPESVGIASGFLIAALHKAGLSILTHTPNPMRFLTELLGRPKSEKPIMILAVGEASEQAKIPAVAKIKKTDSEIMTIHE
jgi:nitroreductase